MPQAYTLLILAAWVLGSGFVAYVCDNLGRRLGKRRLSLWGMRPRHTAMVVTVLTGVGIAALTVALVALVDKDAQRALFHLKELSGQVSSLEKTRDDIESRNSRLLKRNDALRGEIDRAKVSAEKNRRDLFKVGKQRDQVRRQLVEQRQRLHTLTHRYTVVEGDLRTAQRNYDAAQHNLGMARRNLANARRGVLRSEAKLRQTNIELRLAHQAMVLADNGLTQLKRQLDNAREQLTVAKEAESKAKARYLSAESQRSFAEKTRDEARRDLSATRNDLRAARQEANTLASQIATDREQLASLDKSLKESQRHLSDLQRSVNELQDIERDLMVRARNIRRDQVIFSTGQEIARRVIYSPGTREEVRKEIEKLLDAAETFASYQGARPLRDDENRSGAPARCVWLTGVNAISSSGTLRVTEMEETITRILTERIVAEKKDIVLRMVVAANSIRDEPVQVYPEVTINRLIFKSGQTITSQEVDGRLSDARVLEALIDILQTHVRGNALAAGLLPPASGTVGEVNWQVMLDTMKQIRRKNRVVTVDVSAISDVWTADPLLVRFAMST